MRTQEFVKFVKARHDIFLARTALKPKPWTKDVILQSYRFCNVYRELDTVTQWIRQSWRTPLANNPDLWFWMLVARLVNWPNTLQHMTPMALSGEWNAKQFVKVVDSIKKAGDKAWSGAYIVSTNGSSAPKPVYIAEQVLAPAWAARKRVRPGKRDGAPECLQSFCDRLCTLNGVQGFIAGQVIADAKYADTILQCAEDWHTFAISGPGSRRGLRRVFDEDARAPRWPEPLWHARLLELREATNSALKKYNDVAHAKGRPAPYPSLHAQDVQNCLCEFDKYERVRLGEGRPRSTYPGEQ